MMMFFWRFIELKISKYLRKMVTWTEMAFSTGMFYVKQGRRLTTYSGADEYNLQNEGDVVGT